MTGCETYSTAQSGLSEDCREREPDVRWSAIVSMRNLLAHEYFRIEHSQVQDVIEIHVPDLAAAVRRLLAVPGDSASLDGLENNA
jgi:uncharacterized protein with HEPN domain